MSFSDCFCALLSLDASHNCDGDWNMSEAEEERL